MSRLLLQFVNHISCMMSVFRMASTVIQLYLKQVLESFFHSQSQVRMSALEVVVLVLRQGLVHPIQVSFCLKEFRSSLIPNVGLKSRIISSTDMHVAAPEYVVVRTIKVNLTADCLSES